MSNNEYTPVIGLEIHVQLATKTKMFSRCSADWFGKEPNTVVCPVSLGLPGALPVPNKKAIQWAILIGKALNCKTNNVSKFDRKHYFYPDLPKGYQISQYDQPFSYEGSYELIPGKNDTESKKVGITRVHLEEDTGKLIHKGKDSLVDFNRAGMPLVEIVTEPDFDNSEDVKQFLEELQVIVRYLGVSDADMEKGSMRLEPNISVRKPGEEDLPAYKVEVKNINSFRFAKQAIDYEVKRHIALLKKGKIPQQETRGWDESKNMTVSQRVKEEAADYRYMPDPDIPPFALDDDFLANIESMIPELPHEKYERLIDAGVTHEDAYVLTRDIGTVERFEAIVNDVGEKENQLEFKSKTLEEEIAKILVNKKVSDDTSVAQAVEKIIEMLQPVDMDMGKLDALLDKLIAQHSDAVEEYKSGKENAIMFIVGQVMKEMKGQADGQTVVKRLKEKLSK